MIKKIRTVALIIILMLFAAPIQAQKIVCRVKVNLEKMPLENQAKLSDLQNQIDIYINSYEWTPDEYQYDLNCEMELALSEAQVVSYEDRYTASFVISNGVDLLYTDKRCTFAFNPGDRLEHSSAFAPLASLLDFYIYLILAYEFDKLDEFGGDSYYDQALQISISAKSAIQYYRGWDRRNELIKDLQSEANKSFRQLMFHYSNALFLLEADESEEALPHLTAAINLLRIQPPEKLNRFLDLNYDQFLKILNQLKLKEQADILISLKANKNQ